jgi:hypothetical protein
MDILFYTFLSLNIFSMSNYDPHTFCLFLSLSFLQPQVFVKHNVKAKTTFTSVMSLVCAPHMWVCDCLLLP